MAIDIAASLLKLPCKTNGWYYGEKADFIFFYSAFISFIHVWFTHVRLTIPVGVMFFCNPVIVIIQSIVGIAKGIGFAENIFPVECIDNLQEDIQIRAADLGVVHQPQVQPAVGRIPT